MIENGRSLSQVIAELRVEVKDFVQTRYEMLRAEMSEKFTRMKASLPLLAVGAAVLAVSFLVLTATLILAIAAAIATPLAWIWATLIVGVAYLFIGFIALWLGYRELTAAGMKPERTLRVLQQDQAWLQQEARTQL
jgi:hypothetical protein